MTLLIIATILMLTCFNRNNVNASSVNYNIESNKAFIVTSRANKFSGSTVAATTGVTAAIQEKESFVLHNTIQLLPRGGDIAGIAAKDVAKFFCGLVSLDAVSGTFFPSASCGLVGVEIPPKSIRRLAMESLGGAAGSLSISSYLAVTNKVSSMEKAIAYGLISQLFFLARGVVTNSASMTQIIPYFKIDLCLYVSLIFVILSGLLPEPSTWMVKTVIAYKLLNSLRSYFFPTKTGTVSEGESATILWQMAQGYNVLSFFYAALLLYGISPVKAVGFTSLLVFPWFFDLVLIKKVQDMFPVQWLKWMTFLLFPIISVIAIGTLT